MRTEIGTTNEENFPYFPQLMLFKTHTNEYVVYKNKNDSDGKMLRPTFDSVNNWIDEHERQYPISEYLDLELLWDESHKVETI